MVDTAECCISLGRLCAVIAFLSSGQRPNFGRNAARRFGRRRGAQSAALSTAASSLPVSSIGFPFMLPDARAFATASGIRSSVMPR